MFVIFKFLDKMKFKRSTVFDRFEFDWTNVISDNDKYLNTN